MDKHTERTFIMAKPDATHRRLLGKIVQRFEEKGYKLVGMKFLQPSKELLEKHYEDLNARPFFPSLIQYMLSGPVLAMVWEGKDAVAQGRVMLGETNPLSSKPGTIRGDFAVDVGRNICHGSDKVDSANKEIALWFKPEELVSWKNNDYSWIYE